MLLGRLGKFLHVEDQGAVLAALATLAHFHLEDEKAGKQGGDTDRDLFSGKRIDKLLGLVCLNVVTLVSVGQGMTAEEWGGRAEQVRLASKVLRAVKDHGKEVYMASPEGVSGMKNLVRKLEKLAAEEEGEGSGRLLREGVRFALALSPAKGMAMVKPVAGLVEVMQRALAREICGGDNGLIEGELAGEILPALVVSFEMCWDG